MKRILIVVALAGLGLLGTAGTAVATPAPPGPGNSAAAHSCQYGGWQNLVTSTGATFASQDECVAYAAHGGVLAPKPTRTLHEYVTVNPVDPTHCDVHVAGTGFAPNTTYPTTSVLTFPWGSVTVVRSVTTDDSGAFDHVIFNNSGPAGSTVQTTIDGVSSEVQSLAC